MPTIRRWSPTNQSEALLWRIEEPEVFFAMRTGIVSTIKSGSRRVEHLAGRFALTQLLPDIDLAGIVVDATGKPHGPAEWGVHFSLSHSFPFVAVLVHRSEPCGIDVQVPKKNILELQNKYLTYEEKSLFSGKEEMALWAWSVKESLYKKVQSAETELKRDLHINHVEGPETALVAVCSVATAGGKRFVKVAGEVNDNFALAWTV